MLYLAYPVNEYESLPVHFQNSIEWRGTATACEIRSTSERIAHTKTSGSCPDRPGSRQLPGRSDLFPVPDDGPDAHIGRIGYNLDRRKAISTARFTSTITIARLLVCKFYTPIGRCPARPAMRPGCSSGRKRPSPRNRSGTAEKRPLSFILFFRSVRNWRVWCGRCCRRPNALCAASHSRSGCRPTSLVPFLHLICSTIGRRMRKRPNCDSGLSRGFGWNRPSPSIC